GRGHHGVGGDLTTIDRQVRRVAGQGARDGRGHDGAVRDHDTAVRAHEEVVRGVDGAGRRARGVLTTPPAMLPSASAMSTVISTVMSEGAGSASVAEARIPYRDSTAPTAPAAAIPYCRARPCPAAATAAPTRATSVTASMTTAASSTSGES